MSSSDSDVDVDIRPPENIKLRRGGQRNGDTSKVTTNKGKPLVLKNRKQDDDSLSRQRKGRKRRSDPKWDDPSESALTLDSDEESGKGGENQQNKPPPAKPVNGNGTKMTVVDSDEDEDEGSEEQGSSRRPANPRARKRLSMRRQDTAKSNNSIGGEQRENLPPPDPATLKKIYSSCIDLFQAQKITVENAFQIRFLELMGDIIDLPEFDKHDMLGAGRMLEAGARIYVCRVDKTKHSVMDLASTLNMQQKNKKRNQEGDNENELGEMDQGAEEDDVGGEEGKAEAKKKKKKRKMKENQFIVEDISKISLSVEIDSCKGGARRTALKVKFQDFIENDVDFDYFNEYLAKVRDSQQDNEAENFGTEKLAVSSAVVNIAEFGDLQHLSFLLLEEFDKRIHDTWGKRLDQRTETPNLSTHNVELDVEPAPLAPEVDEEHVYVPQEEPRQDYNDDFANNFDDDDRGLAHVSFVNDDGQIEGTQEPLSNGRKMRSLQDFFDLYQKVKSSFGWCGPTFVKTQRGVHMLGGPRKPRVKKLPTFIDIRNINRKDRCNKFLTAKAAKGIFDERNIERWSSKGRPAHPYLEIDEPFDEYEEVLDLINEEEKMGIPNLFKFFIDIRRNLLSSLNVTLPKEDDRLVIEMNKAEDEYINEAGFEVDRHYDDDFDHEQDPDPLADFHVADLPPTGETGAPFNSSFNFPTSLSNLLMEAENDPTQKTDTESIRFTKKPKPIDMHGLKRAILEHLQESLKLHRDGRPYLDTETSTDFLSLLKHVLNTVDVRTAEHMSISILAVGLLHVVVEKKLFVLNNPTNPTNPLIVCRGNLWNHAEHIPMPFEIEDD